ncbi:ATP-binding protein [Zavarzinella formosa]|uniref:ATP-binding protein n=1 Tax=Zavarzinella formosa TaxID=360055 RepID=UPI00030E9936|nr:ATP-binding protein [Zavarzinella formosa]
MIRSLTISPIIRPMFIIAGAAVVLVAINGWGPVPFPNFLVILILVCVLAYQLLALTRRERIAAERRAYDASSRRLQEFARANAELNRELTESRLLEEETNLQVRAFDALLQGVIITDPHKTGNPIIYANERFTSLTGYSREEILGKSIDFLHGKDTSPQTVAAIREALRTAKPCLVETLSHRKDGSNFWNSLSLAPITDSGRHTHFVVVMTDISVFKKLEEQLRQAQKMDAVGHLAGGVAHDFNNLLTVINGCCELLHLGGDVSEEGKPLVDEIHKAGERAANLTQQLLAFSRKTVLQPKILCMNELVRNLVRMLQRLIGEDIQLTTDMPAEIGSVRVDAGQVEQVLMNLAVNARDAMPQGGNLSIETREVYLDEDFTRQTPQLRPGSYVRVSVRDTGHGMDKATMERLFEPFFTTKPVGKGTGLGMAMAYGIVEASKGHIEVSSKPGKGTTFRLYFPVCEDHSRSRFTPVKDESRGGEETILVVEDEDGVRSLTVQSLLAKGYRVLQAANGAEALRVAAAHRGLIDLMVSDVVMPGMSGSDLRSRMLAEYPNLRVIFMSGYTNDAIVRNGVIQLECDFLPKPFTLSMLSRKVREVLDRPPAPVSQATTSEFADTVA